MKLRFQCKQCGGIHMVTISGSEYFLPARCPGCGYRYQDDAVLRLWLDEVRCWLENKRRKK